MEKAFEKAAAFLQERKSEYDRSASLQKQVWEKGQPVTRPLLLISGDPQISMPVHNTKETHFDSEKMLISEMSGALCAAAGGMQAVPSVRANMGCGIFATLFGIRQELFEDKMPWVQQRLDKTTLLRMGPEDLAVGDEFRAGLEHMDYMAERLKGTGCRIYPLDLQSPFSIAHLVYGDSIFYDVYDDPIFVHHMLDLACHALFLGLDECLKRIPGSAHEVCHYSSLVMPRKMGGLKISEDTSTLLSKEMIREFVIPYTQRVLARYGGGYIHYCGRNDHLFREAMNMPLAHGLNLGNPDMHDMEELLRTCAANGKV